MSCIQPKAGNKPPDVFKSYILILLIQEAFDNKLFDVIESAARDKVVDEAMLNFIINSRIINTTLNNHLATIKAIKGRVRRMHARRSFIFISLTSSIGPPASAS